MQKNSNFWYAGFLANSDGIFPQLVRFIEGLLYISKYIKVNLEIVFL